VARDEVLGTDAGVFLVGDERQQHVPCERPPRERGGGAHDRRGAALHVVAAAAEQLAVAHDGSERRLHALGADGVAVGAQHQGGPWSTVDAGNGVRPAAAVSLFPRLDAVFAQPRAGERRDGVLAVRLVRRDVGIDGRAADQRFSELANGVDRQWVPRAHAPLTVAHSAHAPATVLRRLTIAAVAIANRPMIAPETTPTIGPTHAISSRGGIGIVAPFIISPSPPP